MPNEMEQELVANVVTACERVLRAHYDENCVGNETVCVLEYALREYRKLNPQDIEIAPLSIQHAGGLAEHLWLHTNLNMNDAKRVIDLETTTGGTNARRFRGARPDELDKSFLPG